MCNIKYIFMIILTTSIHFRIRPDRPWGPLSLLHNMHRVSFPGVKRPGRGVSHSHPSSAEVRGRLDLYSTGPPPPWAWMAWYRVNVTFTFTISTFIRRNSDWILAVGLRPLAAFAGSNPAGDIDVCLFWMLCVVSASGWSVIEGSPTLYECVLECDQVQQQNTTTMKRWGPEVA